MIFSLSSCAKLASPFVNLHPQTKQDFDNARSPEQNDLAFVLQQSNLSKGEVTNVEQLGTLSNGSVNGTMLGPNQIDDSDCLKPIIVKQYGDRKTIYQLNSSEQVASFVQVMKVEKDLKNPPALNHKREEIAQELAKYKLNQVEDPSQDFFSMADDLPVIPALETLENSEWESRKRHPINRQHPHYYDTQYQDSTRPHYLQDSIYVQQPERIEKSPYKHYPKMLQLEEDGDWLVVEDYKAENLGYYKPVDNENISRYKKFFSAD